MTWYATAFAVLALLTLIVSPWGARIAAFTGATPWYPAIWYYRARTAMRDRATRTRGRSR